jgi:polyphosphate glucokinase
MPPRRSAAPKVLVVDIGGSHVKLLGPGQRTPTKLDSGPSLTPREMVRRVKAATAEWDYEVVSIGYPGPVLRGRPVAEPHNLGRGWVAFDFRRAFGGRRRVKIVNDAAMQALGSYAGGRMLFLGLGTGLGAALIIDGVLIPLELAHLPYRKGETFEDYLGVRGLDRLGEKRWETHVAKVADLLRRALVADYVVLGGGNVKRLERLPPKTRRGANRNAFTGGRRLWDAESRVARKTRARRS